jgi:hypothetical protein
MSLKVVHAVALAMAGLEVEALKKKDEQEMKAVKKKAEQERKFYSKMSLAAMKAYNIKSWTVAQIIEKMPVLLVWAEECVVESHTKERREYLLQVLAEKNDPLARSVEYLTRKVESLKQEMDRAEKDKMATIENKWSFFEKEKNKTILAIRDIEKQMIIVGKLLDPEEMEPSIFDEAADRGPEEPMSLNQ